MLRSTSTATIKETLCKGNIWYLEIILQADSELREIYFKMHGSYIMYVVIC